jgi:hypothetical protein
MRPVIAIALLWVGALALAEERTQTREMLGHLGGRDAVVILHENARDDGSARLSGEYLLLPTLQRRYLEGERGPQLGVTYLKEGSSPILYGRPGTATLQGTWSGGLLKGTRYAPGGQERERFEFSEAFPDMSDYSAEVRCELAEGRYRSTLGYAVAQGRLQRLEWRSQVAPGGHSCALAGLEQREFAGGLRFVAGQCVVTLRDLGDYVRVAAEHCGEFCGSQAYFEPVLVERGGACRLLRPQAR